MSDKVRYKDVELIKKELFKLADDMPKKYCDAIIDCINTIDNVPTADVVPKDKDKSERLRELLTLAKTDMLYLLLELKATGEKFNAEKLIPALFVLRNEHGFSVEKVNTDFATICDYLEEDAE